MKKFLIIQTSFIGDVVLATSLAEKLHAHYPGAQIDFLLRKGNEGLLRDHPFIHKVWVWNKKERKIPNLLRLCREIRKERYDAVINPHRFASSGLVCLLSGAKFKSGFDKNPLSVTYTHKYPHIIAESAAGPYLHETQRNQLLVQELTDKQAMHPALYPTPADYERVKAWKGKPYICIAPSSVWFTKQFPAEKWVSFITALPGNLTVYLLGAPSDVTLASQLIEASRRKNIENLCGQLDFLQSAALMKDAVMNYVNDSAPLHFCSAVQAPVTAVYCSTVPSFGFGPLGHDAHIVQLASPLYCRPCGLHGHKACPEGHFRCAMEITNQQLLATLPA